MVLSLGSLIIFASAEFVTYYMNAITGVVIYFIMLLGLLVSSALTREENWRGLWLALGLVPIIRVASLTMQPVAVSHVYWYALSALPALAGALAVRRTLKYSYRETGVCLSAPTVQGLMVAMGISLGIIDYFILRPDALNSSLSVRSMLLPALVLLISTGFVEELAFRGVIQRAASGLSSWGWVYVAAIYSVLQIGRGSVLHLGFVCFVALYFGWVVKRTGSIVGVSLAHGALNIVLYLVCPHLF